MGAGWKRLLRASRFLTMRLMHLMRLMRNFGVIKPA